MWLQYLRKQIGKYLRPSTSSLSVYTFPDIFNAQYFFTCDPISYQMLVIRLKVGGIIKEIVSKICVRQGRQSYQ